MTAPATTRRAGPFDGNGVTTSFPFTFKVFATSDVRVVRADVDNVETVLSLGVDYNITLNADQDSSPGGTINYPISGTPLPVGEKLAAVGALPYDQTADLPSGGNYRAIVVENALDRGVFQVQQLLEEVDRAMTLPVSLSGVDTTLPTPEGGKVLAWNPAGTALVNTASVPLGSDASDIAYAPGGTGADATDVQTWMRRTVFVADYGNTLADVQLAIERCFTLGGGTVVCAPGVTYTGTALPIVRVGVLLEMNRATFTATLGSGNVYGLRLSNYSGVRNGTINVISTGTPSSQLIFHNAISLGEANSNGGTPASPSEFSTVHHFLVQKMTVGTTRQYCPAIQGAGNLYAFLIEDIEIPSSSTCSGVHLDWSDIGSPVSSSNIAGTRAAFDLGNCYTTHPHHGTIRRITCGNLSVPASADLGSSIVRLSACYDIRVEDLYAENVTLTGFRQVGGDLGFEFAPPEVKRHACRGIRVRNVTLGNMAATGTADGIWVDTFADNVYREKFLTGYSPMLDPQMHGDVIVEGGSLVGPNADSQNGVRIIQARGVKIRNVNLSRWKYGAWIDEFSQYITLEGSTITGNREHGVKVGFGRLRENTRDVVIRGNNIYANGTTATGHGVEVARGHDILIEDNTFGWSSETTQVSGVVVLDDQVANYGIVLRGNRCEGATSSAWSLTGSSPSGPYAYRQIGIVEGNTVHPRVTTFFGGQPYLPVRSLEGTTNLPCREWLNPNSAAPTDGTWYRGEILTQTTPSAAAIPGHVVTTSGTFGTLSGLTNAATTNTSRDVTMSLAARTATTTANSYLVVVSTAANLRTGLKCNIAAAGITNATILSVSGTDVQLDTPANATQAGGAFVTAGVVEGEVVSLNTTPAISSAMVRKVNGTTVTLSVAASSTETGRTVSYTTPVFKAMAVVAA